MSVVKAYPKTGRTHQIRVHLMSLGHPIANDQMYGEYKGLLPITNDGKEQPPAAMFHNSYENKEVDGKKNFMSLWLHAYRYTVPAEVTGGDGMKVKSKKPEWALQTFKFVPQKT